ncbi:hypothetical protein ml_291 [Mollivirus sibericum]|uniref:hypothetical protein n=1 Tax=Mollivirus sibericum TaxID=1678078 RepID=UPI0006B2DB7A|nr:hypothetical protein ml_291 [Mollivirus sibericum]ALD62093.1 hypothetical protein ml_291 [Mollivirus sibericum]
MPRVSAASADVSAKNTKGRRSATAKSGAGGAGGNSKAAGLVAKKSPSTATKVSVELRRALIDSPTTREVAVNAATIFRNGNASMAWSKMIRYASNDVSPLASPMLCVTLLMLRCQHDMHMKTAKQAKTEQRKRAAEVAADEVVATAISLLITQGRHSLPPVPADMPVMRKASNKEPTPVLNSACDLWSFARTMAFVGLGTDFSAGGRAKMLNLLTEQWSDMVNLREIPNTDAWTDYVVATTPDDCHAECKRASVAKGSVIDVGTVARLLIHYVMTLRTLYGRLARRVLNPSRTNVNPDGSPDIEPYRLCVGDPLADPVTEVVVDEQTGEEQTVEVVDEEPVNRCSHPYEQRLLRAILAEEEQQDDKAEGEEEPSARPDWLEEATEEELLYEASVKEDLSVKPETIRIVETKIAVLCSLIHAADFYEGRTVVVDGPMPTQQQQPSAEASGKKGSSSRKGNKGLPLVPESFVKAAEAMEIKYEDWGGFLPNVLVNTQSGKALKVQTQRFFTSLVCRTIGSLLDVAVGDNSEAADDLSLPEHAERLSAPAVAQGRKAPANADQVAAYDAKAHYDTVVKPLRLKIEEASKVSKNSLVFSLFAEAEAIASKWSDQLTGLISCALLVGRYPYMASVCKGVMVEGVDDPAEERYLFDPFFNGGDDAQYRAKLRAKFPQLTAIIMGEVSIDDNKARKKNKSKRKPTGKGKKKADSDEEQEEEQGEDAGSQDEEDGDERQAEEEDEAEAMPEYDGHILLANEHTTSFANIVSQFGSGVGPNDCTPDHLLVNRYPLWLDWFSTERFPADSEEQDAASDGDEAEATSTRSKRGKAKAPAKKTAQAKAKATTATTTTNKNKKKKPDTDDDPEEDQEEEEQEEVEEEEEDTAIDNNKKKKQSPPPKATQQKNASARPAKRQQTIEVGTPQPKEAKKPPAKKASVEDKPTARKEQPGGRSGSKSAGAANAAANTKTEAKKTPELDDQETDDNANSNSSSKKGKKVVADAIKTRAKGKTPTPETTPSADAMEVSTEPTCKNASAAPVPAAAAPSDPSMSMFNNAIDCARKTGASVTISISTDASGKSVTTLTIGSSSNDADHPAAPSDGKRNAPSKKRKAEDVASEEEEEEEEEKAGSRRKSSKKPSPKKAKSKQSSEDDSDSVDDKEEEEEEEDRKHKKGKSKSKGKGKKRSRSSSSDLSDDEERDTKRKRKSHGDKDKKKKQQHKKDKSGKSSKSGKMSKAQPKPSRPSPPLKPASESVVQLLIAASVEVLDDEGSEEVRCSRLVNAPTNRSKKLNKAVGKYIYRGPFLPNVRDIPRLQANLYQAFYARSIGDTSVQMPELVYDKAAHQFYTRTLNIGETDTEVWEKNTKGMPIRTHHHLFLEGDHLHVLADVSKEEYTRLRKKTKKPTDDVIFVPVLNREALGVIPLSTAIDRAFFIKHSGSVFANMASRFISGHGESRLASHLVSALDEEVMISTGPDEARQSLDKIVAQVLAATKAPAGAATVATNKNEEADGDNNNSEDEEQEDEDEPKKATSSSSDPFDIIRLLFSKVPAKEFMPRVHACLAHFGVDSIDEICTNALNADTEALLSYATSLGYTAPVQPLDQKVLDRIRALQHCVSVYRERNPADKHHLLGLDGGSSDSGDSGSSSSGNEDDDQPSTMDLVDMNDDATSKANKRKKAHPDVIFDGDEDSDNKQQEEEEEQEEEDDKVSEASEDQQEQEEQAVPNDDDDDDNKSEDGESPQEQEDPEAQVQDEPEAVAAMEVSE